MKNLFQIVTVGLAALALSLAEAKAEGGCSRDCAPRERSMHHQTRRQLCPHCRARLQDTRRYARIRYGDNGAICDRGTPARQHIGTEATGRGLAPEPAIDETLVAEPVVEEAIEDTGERVAVPVKETTKAERTETTATSPDGTAGDAPASEIRNKPRGARPRRDIVPEPPEPNPADEFDAAIFDLPIEFDGFGYVLPARQSMRYLGYPK